MRLSKYSKISFQVILKTWINNNSKIWYILDTIRSEDWTYRQASMLAFAAILEGPTKDVVSNMISQAFPLILEFLKDPN